MYLENSKTIIVKIGSSLIIDDKKIIRKKWLLEFAKDIKALRKKNKNIIIVSSGAIALGCKKLNITKKKLKIDQSQAVASVGQIELMNLFKEVFAIQKINISQILLTLEDTEIRRRAINAKRTIENLFNLNFIPIVNENDTIATSEIKYGDNDRLASRVAQISDADCLVLLSDVDGLYTKNPKIHKDAKLINKIEKIDQNIIKLASGKTSEYGSGGMRTKIDAAKICALSGCKMAIANGLKERPLSNILDKKINLATFDFTPEIIDGILKGRISFALDQQQYLQGYLPVVLMNLYITNKNTPAYKKLETGPSIIDIKNAQDVLSLSKKGKR